MPKRKKRRKTGVKRQRRLLRVILVGVALFLFVCVAFILFLRFLGSEALEVEDPTGMSRHREERFIEEMADEAIKLEEEYGIRPSVTIAQAILESNWGQSGLAQNENNYFGIKGSSDSPQYETREYYEEWAEVEANFRSYSSWQESMEDYARLLTYGTAWDETLYHGVIEAESYQEAAHELKEAGYATDPDYPEKVIHLIERHELDQYDEWNEAEEVVED